MRDDIAKIINLAPKDMDGKAPTPTTRHLLL